MSGVVPQVAAMMGPGAAGTAYIPGLADFVPMVKGVSSMALGGPHLVKAAVGEDVTEQEMGGSQVHNKISGVVASPYGYHVFKALGRRGPRTRKFEDVKAEVERRATAEKRAQAERQLLQQLRSSAQIKIDDTTLALVQ